MAGVQTVAACRLAVEVPAVLYGGTITDHRDGEGDYRVPVVTGYDTILRKVPVYERHEETVWEARGLLGILEPVTKNRYVQTGWEVIEELVPLTTDVALHLRWSSDHIVWERFEVQLLMTLQAGSDFLQDGSGVLVQACDGETLYERAPAAPGDPDVTKAFLGHDAIGAEVEDGWYASILGPDLALDEGRPMPRLDRVMVLPRDVREEAREAATAFAEENAAEPTVIEEPMPEDATSGAASEGASYDRASFHIKPLATSTSLAGVLAAAGLVVAGLAAYVVRRL